MKTFFRNAITAILIRMAAFKLARSGAKIIGITGSVGKSSTKDAIVLLLSQKYNVHSDKGGYNTDIGLSLALLGLSSPMSSSVLAWLQVLGKGLKHAVQKDRYDFFVAEMGVDAPGDMDVILTLVQPHIAVLTSIAPVHLAPGQFSSMEEILKEKQKIFSKQTQSDIAILNVDDLMIAPLEKQLSAQTLTYGQHGSQLVIGDASTSIQGTSFTATYNGESEEFFIPVLGSYHASLVAPGILIALQYGYTLQETRDILTTYNSPKGRMRLIEGKNGSTIIDGSYNASVLSVKAGIDTLASLDVPRKILCLGNMNELGEQSVRLHKEVGAYTKDKADLLITVARDAKVIADTAKEYGFPESNVHFFEDSTSAGQFLAPLLQPGDAVFVKGSQNGVRMEKLIKEIMLAPENAADQLVRQANYWTKK